MSGLQPFSSPHAQIPRQLYLPTNICKRNSIHHHIRRLKLGYVVKETTKVMPPAISAWRQISSCQVSSTGYSGNYLARRLITCCTLWSMALHFFLVASESTSLIVNFAMAALLVTCSVLRLRKISLRNGNAGVMGFFFPASQPTRPIMWA